MSSQAMRPIKARPRIGPTTAPAIHALLLGLSSGISGMVLGLSADEGSDVGMNPEEVVRCEDDDADVVLSVVFKNCFREKSSRTVCRRNHCRCRLLSVIAPQTTFVSGLLSPSLSNTSIVLQTVNVESSAAVYTEVLLEVSLVQAILNDWSIPSICSLPL
jgi:hypothetical protein